MRHANLVTVDSTLDPVRANILKDLLRANGVPCVLGGILRSRGLCPILDIQIQVSIELAAGARQLISFQNKVPVESIGGRLSTSRIDHHPGRPPLDGAGQTELATAAPAA